MTDMPQPSIQTSTPEQWADSVTWAIDESARQWNDWRHALISFTDLENPHWDDTSGGVRTRAPQMFIHGYILCTDPISGELAHSCEHGEAPHRIKVCVVKKDNNTAVINRLLKITGPRP